jgi:hypothetical protein
LRRPKALVLTRVALSELLELLPRLARLHSHGAVERVGLLEKLHRGVAEFLGLWVGRGGGGKRGVIGRLGLL